MRAPRLSQGAQSLEYQGPRNQVVTCTQDRKTGKSTCYLPSPPPAPARPAVFCSSPVRAGSHCNFRGISQMSCHRRPCPRTPAARSELFFKHLSLLTALSLLFLTSSFPVTATSNQTAHLRPNSKFAFSTAIPLPAPPCQSHPHHRAPSVLTSLTVCCRDIST